LNEVLRSSFRLDYLRFAFSLIELENLGADPFAGSTADASVLVNNNSSGHKCKNLLFFYMGGDKPRPYISYSFCSNRRGGGFDELSRVVYALPLN